MLNFLIHVTCGALAFVLLFWMGFALFAFGAGMASSWFGIDILAGMNNLMAMTSICSVSGTLLGLICWTYR